MEDADAETTPWLFPLLEMSKEAKPGVTGDDCLHLGGETESDVQMATSGLLQLVELSWHCIVVMVTQFIINKWIVHL